MRIRRRDAVLVVQSSMDQTDLLQRARRVIGISVVQPALRVSKAPADAADAALRLARDIGGLPRFAVRARRRDKHFPMTSEQLAGYIGARVQKGLGWPVNLGDPQVEIFVEVHRHEVFVSVERHRGQGGLPIGSSGRALVLLSGGFDSPVAAYRAMRRGLHCEFLHFTGAPLTGPASTYKAYAHVRQLDRFQYGSRLHVVAIGTAQRTLAVAGARTAQVIAQRRLMLRTAEALAKDCGAHALVTGDSLGQVASQTLSNLETVETAASLPLLRPLLCWDKDEMLAEGRRIGTADISALPDEDCCSLLSPPHPATHTSVEQLTEIEERSAIGTLIPQLLAKRQILIPQHDNT